MKKEKVGSIVKISIINSCGGQGCDIKPYILPYGIAA